MTFSMLLTALAPVLAQAAVPAAPAAPASAPPPGPEEARLAECLEYSRNDPPTALTLAGEWLSETTGPASSNPYQCLGQTYVSLLRWDAAAEAFETARAARPATDGPGRARLAAMAGNARLATGDAQAALASFDQAMADLADAADPALGASIEADRSIALVQLDRPDEAAAALERAQAGDPQSARIWLLTATLARRQDRLEAAVGAIRTAVGLAPNDPAVVLEAGVIAALAGDGEAARHHFNRILSVMPESDEAETARGYLAQLDRPAE